MLLYILFVCGMVLGDVFGWNFCNICSMFVILLFRLFCFVLLTIFWLTKQVLLLNVMCVLFYFVVGELYVLILILGWEEKRYNIISVLYTINLDCLFFLLHVNVNKCILL